MPILFAPALGSPSVAVGTSDVREAWKVHLMIAAFHAFCWEGLLSGLSFMLQAPWVTCPATHLPGEHGTTSSLLQHPSLPCSNQPSLANPAACFLCLGLLHSMGSSACLGAC